MKRKLFLIVLVAIAAMMIAACASSEPVSTDPNEAEAKALYAEVTGLREQFLPQGKDETTEPYGRAKAIYDLGSTYMGFEMYTEALEPLGQAKTYYTRFLQ